MPVIDPKTIPVPELHQLLVGSIGPRPIALASTVDAGGRPNLAPFSFFNIFSSNPPICIFSANLRVMNNTTKDTLRNVQQTGEVVINAVNFSIIRQVALASVEYPAEVSEFHETGLTPIASDLVKPFRVKESPVQFECKVKEILPLGENGGAGNLIVCEILRIHVDEKILDEQGKINPHKIDLMGRLGRSFYVRASGEAVHLIHQPTNKIGIGYHKLPESARQSEVLTGNNLGQLAAITAPPGPDDVEELRQDAYITEALQKKPVVNTLHRIAQRELAKENIELAARIVWLADTIK